MEKTYVVVVSNSELLDDDSDHGSDDELLLPSEELNIARSVVVLGKATCQ